MTPAQEVKKRMEGKPTEQVIIELLLLPRMVVFKHSPPITREEAEEEIKLYGDAVTFTAAIVPADKYKREAERAETLGNLADNPKGYRSRVE